MRGLALFASSSDMFDNFVSIQIDGLFIFVTQEPAINTLIALLNRPFDLDIGSRRR